MKHSAQTIPAQYRSGLRGCCRWLLPRRRLADARLRARAYEAYLDRLNGARSAGDLDDRAYSILSEEYRVGVENSRAGLAQLEAQADLWRRDGQVILDACADWVQLELDVHAARRLVEQQQTPDDRTTVLERERDRIDEAKRVLASL